MLRSSGLSQADLELSTLVLLTAPGRSEFITISEQLAGFGRRHLVSPCCQAALLDATNILVNYQNLRIDLRHMHVLVAAVQASSEPAAGLGHDVMNRVHAALQHQALLLKTMKILRTG